MFLKAGAWSMALLLASRLLGLVRESAVAGAFGTSGLADVVVLMLTLPDLLVGVLVSGAMGYVLLPAWAGRSRALVRESERRVAWGLFGLSTLLALLLLLFRHPLLEWLAGGVPLPLLDLGAQALVWSALALPAAVLAALWSTRLQHEADFVGMYSANLVVNAVVVAAIAGGAALSGGGTAVHVVGAGMLGAMALRLFWLRWRIPAADLPVADGPFMDGGLPGPRLWLWAVLSAGLPLALPFVARSIASQGGSGGLSTFNYAWKLIELPFVLGIQLVVTLALPGIARALATKDAIATRAAVRSALALAWALACGAAATLLVGAPAVTDLLFGWGRMEPAALERVALWGGLGAWGLLPQAVIAVTLAVLAGRGRMQVAVFAYATALLLLLAAGAAGWTEGASLMLLLNMLFALVAAVIVVSLGSGVWEWVPWPAMAISFACLLAMWGFAAAGWLPIWPGRLWPGLLVAAVAGLLVVAATWWGSLDLRLALAR